MAEVYQYVTQAQFLQQLANRLFDPTETFWGHTEKTLYLQMALRIWNSLTGYWRGDFTFPTVANQVWYDLTSASDMPNSLRLLTVKDTLIYQQLEYSLLEPAPSVNPINPWTGSLQFTANDLLSAVQRRRDEILSTSSCQITRHTVAAAAGRTILPDTVIDIRRVAYLGTGQAASVMFSEDAWGEQDFNRNYTIATPGTPLTWLLSAQPPISFDTDRSPAYAGSYEVLSIDAGAALSVSAPSTFTVPDDFTWLLYFGALSDLFNRESEAKDLLRGNWCEKLYQLGLATLSSGPALLALRLANVPLQIDSVRDGDLFNTTWQGQAASQPGAAYYAGLNLIGLGPPPNSGPYSLTATVVKNAPIPSGDSDFVQIGRDELDVLLDLCVHIAMTKVGGAEYVDTQPLLQRFLNMAALCNRKLAELGEFKDVMYALSQREQAMNPVAQEASS